jgi:hypothetical protein
MVHVQRKAAMHSSSVPTRPASSDWSAIVETNRAALLRVAALLFEMAGWTMEDGHHPRPIRATLPRALYFAMLALLRPAEAAVRRLIIMAAREVVVTLGPMRARRPQKPAPLLYRRVDRSTAIRPFPLLDALIDVRHRPAGQAIAAAMPRIRALGLAPAMVADLYRQPARKPLRRFTALERFDPSGAASHVDAFAAVTLCKRLLAMKAALDDLPRQAIRFARWQARRDRALDRQEDDTGRPDHPGHLRRLRRFAALRHGHPPGYRPRLRPPRSAHDEERHHLNDLLADCHDLALRALAHDDSS